MHVRRSIYLWALVFALAPLAAQQGPSPTTELAVLVDTSAQPGPGDAAAMQLRIVGEIRHEGAPLKSIAYTVTDDAGRVVVNVVDTPPRLKYIDDRHVLYLSSEPIRPGQYQMTTVALDEEGRRGSVERKFVIQAWPAHPVRVGDLVFGDVVGGVFRPSAQVNPGAARVAVRLDVHSEDPAALQGLTATLLVERLDGTGIITREAIPLAPMGTRRERGGFIVLETAAYERGEYRLTAIVSNEQGEIQRKVRLLNR